MSDVARTTEAVWKIESTRLIAAIARVTHDIGIAEELAQDALVTALGVWPREGIPENPGAWLMTAAKRRAIDSLRRSRMLLQKHEEIARDLEFQQQQLGDALEHSLDQVIDDDILRLIFTACHPILSMEGRIALTLRLIGGLTTAEIARAFLVPEKTLGQRISRAKVKKSPQHRKFQPVFASDHVAEGIETELQLDQLRALNCEQGQGFYFSIPVDGESATALIERDERGEVLRILEQETTIGGFGMIEERAATLA